jgi:hypothetical protein
MRGLRRHQHEPGLDDDRRTLIHRYMVEPAQPKPPVEHIGRVIDLVVPEPEAPADPIPARSVLDLVPPAPERREGSELSVKAFRQTLEQVVRLSAQVAETRVECGRRRERLAAG